MHILLSLPYFDHITFRGKHRRKVNYWFSSNCWRRNYYFWNQCFLHWKGEVRLSSASHVIRPGKSFPNFNSKFSANLDFKEFELRPLNLQQVYVPCQIKGALAFQTHSSKRFVFLRIIQMFDASWHDLHLLSIFSTCYNLKTTKQTIFSIKPNICHVFLSTTNSRQSPQGPLYFSNPKPNTTLKKKNSKTHLELFYKTVCSRLIGILVYDKKYFNYHLTRSLGPSGPWLLAWGPSGLLTSSFATFGRSGRVTHALVIG